MLSYLDLTPATGAAQRLHETSARSVLKTDGLTGVTAIRGQTWSRPEEHGAVEPAKQFMSERLIVIEGEIWGASQDAAWADWQALSAACLNCLSADALLTWQEGPSGPNVQGTVRLAGPVQPSIGGWAPIVAYQLQLRQSDPRWYSQTETNSGAAAIGTSGGLPFPLVFPLSFGTLTGGSVAVTNAGNVDTWPRYEITGPISSPYVTNATTGETISFPTLSVAAGQTLVIQTRPGAPRSATVAGVNVAGSILWSSSIWPRLAPGSNTIQFGGGSSTGATGLTVFSRDAYL